VEGNLQGNIVTEVQRLRLKRKLEQRDRRIKALQERISELQYMLVTKDMEIKRLPRDVTRAVQEALCNVRMIPILGIGGDKKIVEIKVTEQEKGKTT
jgi:predicted RNase H-like nuclease (RuvC/YqgF family)